ncbi:uncharacterized protein LOC136076354 [Hydra vulgaris]|uniref:Uncharacterized protein LOC136076354 n=1 Tax=Hydra vulgaris TaxID=6087 RepID=A0ABM4BAE0_HYDVU
MFYARGVWIEDGIETEGVVPCNWIINNKLYWPNGVSVVQHFQLLSKPDITKWKQYKYLSTKCVGDEQTCHDYEFITTQEEKSATEESLQESSNEEDNIVVPIFPSVVSPQLTLKSKPQLSTLKKSCSIKKLGMKKSIQCERSVSPSLKSMRKIAIPSRKLNQITHPEVKRRHGCNYPLTNEIFQKTVINLLTQIPNKLEDVTICGCSSLTQTQMPLNDETFKFCHINSMEELHKLNSDLNDDANFTSFKTQLSRIGRKSIKINIKNILQRYATRVELSDHDLQNLEKYLVFKILVYAKLISRSKLL